MNFGGPGVDAAIAQELLRGVEPIAIEAAFEAERMHRKQQEDRDRILALEIEQARYEARLAERRYAACDPDNRLIAAQLEKSWEQALQRVKELEARQFAEQPQAIEVAPGAFANLAGELSAAWNALKVNMRARQQLLRTLITDIVANVDDETREVILTGEAASECDQTASMLTAERRRVGSVGRPSSIPRTRIVRYPAESGALARSEGELGSGAHRSRNARAVASRRSSH